MEIASYFDTTPTFSACLELPSDVFILVWSTQKALKAGW